MRSIPTKSAATFMIVCAILLSGCAQEEFHPAPWGYTGDKGPQYWGTLRPEYALADSGREQSPIDIVEARAVSLAPLSFFYDASELEIENTGQTIEVRYQPGSHLAVDGTRYELQQFHFHSPSETTFEGRHAEIEMHLVHADANGRLAVVAVMLEEGERNPALDPVWMNMPGRPGNTLKPKDMVINAGSLLPADRAHYRFPGSLTTPPCSEGVQWFVLRSPIGVSKEQVKAFRTLYFGNNRPVQPLNHREVLLAP